MEEEAQQFIKALEAHFYKYFKIHLSVSKWIF